MKQSGQTCGKADVFEVITQVFDHGETPEALEARLMASHGCTRALLVLDSAGFTRVTHSHGIVHCLQVIARARRVLRPLFESYGGTGFRAEADNMYADFADVSTSLDAALAANRALDRDPIMLTDEEPYKICVGIGYGAFLRSAHEGLFGHEMNLASRLGEDTAKGGEILLTAAAYDALPADRRHPFRCRRLTVAGTPMPYFATHFEALSEAP